MTQPAPSSTPARPSAGTTSDLYPSLCYADAQAAIAWLCKTFGFTERLVVPGPDGSIAHSELSLGNAVIMVASPHPERGFVPLKGKREVSQAISVRVDDPDAHHARAKAAGAKITRPLRDEEYGSRGYMADDLEGHQWYFGTYRPGAHWGSTPGAHA